MAREEATTEKSAWCLGGVDAVWDHKMNNIKPGSFFVCFKRSYGQSSSRLPSQYLFG